jgi:hypothetical protein
MKVGLIKNKLTAGLSVAMKGEYGSALVAAKME